MGLNATTLSIEGRIVSRCEGGALQAELALFKPRDSKARLPAGETSIVTSVREARARLDAVGATVSVAEEVAGVLAHEALEAYALSDAVRTIGARLGPSELFDGKTYDAESQTYDGMWIDLRALTTDLGVAGSGLALQALYLAVVMAETDPDASISLAVEADSTKTQSPSFERLPPEYVRRLTTALRGLRPIARRARIVNGDELRDELTKLVRDRVHGRATEAARTRLDALDLAIASVDVPSRGPLASVELWAIERQLSANDARGVDDKLDAIERARGKTQATRYLREHSAFVRGSEAPRRIAERLSHWMRPGTPFHELELLKARAWLAAGMPGYARHYARGLVEDRGAPDGVCLIALEILEVTSQRSRTQVPPPATSGPQSIRSAPIVLLESRDGPPPSETGAKRDRSSVLPPPPEPLPQSSARESPPPPPPAPPPAPPPPDAVRTARASRPSPGEVRVVPRRPSVPAQGEVRVVPRRPSVPAQGEVRVVPKRPSVPAQGEVRVRRSSRPPPLVNSDPDAETLDAPRPRAPSRPPRAPREEARDEVIVAHASPAPGDAPGVRVYKPIAQLPPGGSQAPYASELPPATTRMAEVVIPPDARLPNDVPPRIHEENLNQPPPRPIQKVNRARYIPETIETLPLPHGLTESMLAAGVVPKTPDEARIACTRMARELARDYRLWYGLRLQTNAIAIETMQRHLLSRWPDGRLEGEDAPWELRRHGALLSEILARALAGYWLDVKPTELGYWAMFVPPRTRTWPFGRIVRFVSMGHREKDLVSYYLELVARAREPA